MTGTAIDTPRGVARAVLDRPGRAPHAVLVLGHGAGGDIDAPDLVAVRATALAAGLAVARIIQPYRVAGRRAPAPAPHLDEAWLAAVSWVRRRSGLAAPPLIVGGRSSGARVAARTAIAAGAAGVIALAFPVHPPGRPDRDRSGELATGLPTLVVNGDRDPFGIPVAGGAVEVSVRPGERHDLRRDPAGSAARVGDWLARHGWGGVPGPEGVPGRGMSR